MDESRIDDLYRGPLSGFTAAREVLAKTLGGAEASRIRKLAKPTLVPWAVNQVRWKAAPVYDRLLKSGVRLRQAQLAAMQGRSADVRAASDAHRTAVADAVKAARRLSAGSGPGPAADALMRMFEAVSLAATSPEPHGRFTRPVQPAGFEAIAGVKPRALPRPLAQGQKAGPTQAPSASSKVRNEEARKARAAARDEKLRVEAVRKAETMLEHARVAEATARRIWERAKRELESAKQMAAGLRR